MQNETGALIGRFGITIFLNLLFSLIFLGAGNKDDTKFTNFQSHFGAVTMLTISSMFGSATPIMLAFPFERPMFMREYSTGTYGATAYFTSKLCSEMPLNFCQICLAYLFAYNMMELNGLWIYLILTAWGLGLVGRAADCLLNTMLYMQHHTIVCMKYEILHETCSILYTKLCTTVYIRTWLHLLPAAR